MDDREEMRYMKHPTSCKKNPEWPKIRLVEGLIERVRHEYAVPEYWDNGVWRVEDVIPL